jgi:hypothetical protein
VSAGVPAAAQIAGAYSRPLMMRNGGFFVETEHDVNVVDIQTFSVFVDIRIRTDRDGQVECDPPATSLSDYSLEQLTVLANNHCFAGFSVIDYDIPGYDGHPVCNRLHCFDWAPTSAKRGNNQWRVQPEFEKGGWVELGVAKDEHGQAAYVEHWATIPGSRDGPFLAMRRSTANGALDAMLVVAGSTFGYIVERAQPLLAAEAGGDNGSFQGETAGIVGAEIAKAEAASARGDSEELAKCRARIEGMLDMECSVGRIEQDGSWIIERSTFPWLRGTNWMAPAANARRVVGLDVAGGTAKITTSGAGEDLWEVFENEGVDAATAAQLFGTPATAAAGAGSKL